MCDGVAQMYGFVHAASVLVTGGNATSMLVGVSALRIDAAKDGKLLCFDKPRTTAPLMREALDYCTG